MAYRIFGAILVIVGCACTGFLVAANAKRETASLKDLIYILEFCKNELTFRLTPLPELCRQAAAVASGTLSKFFIAVALELEHQISPDAEKCIHAALGRFTDMPVLCTELLISLGKNFGRFDLNGQVQGIDHILAEAERLLAHHTGNQEVRLRSYKTLGLCAGAAIVILFI